MYAEYTQDEAADVRRSSQETSINTNKDKFLKMNINKFLSYFPIIGMIYLIILGIRFGFKTHILNFSDFEFISLIFIQGMSPIIILFSIVLIIII